MAVPPNQNQDPFLPVVPRNDNDVTWGDVDHEGNNAVPGIDTANAVPGGDSAVAANGRPRRNIGSYKDGPAKIRRLPIDGESYELAYPTEAPFSCLYPVPAISNRAGRPSNYHPNEKMQKQFLAECYLLQDTWFQESNCFSSLADHMLVDTWDDGMDGTYFNDVFDPRILEARSNSEKAKETDDAPSFDTAVRNPFQAQWWKAMYDELQTIMVDFDCWEYVIRMPDMNVLPSTWAFKIKRYPDGRVKKFKARFCARGDRQKEGIDYFETWALVVQWSTVRIAMILAIKLKLVSVQCDITAAFIHGQVPSTETIYVHQPRGFHRGQGDEVLRLKCTLYGLKQSSRYFFQYLTKRLVKQGLTASAFDPCLFISKNLTVVIYVDDILIYGRTTAEIDALIVDLQKDDISLNKEGTAEGYLGVDISTEGGKVILRQEGLTK